MSISQAQLVIKPIDPVNNPLIDSLVGQLVGSGVIVQNVRSNLVETSRALATFKAPQQLLGIKAGLMMVTGIADTMAGANTGGVISGQIPYSDTTDEASQGRMMLSKVLNPVGSTTQRNPTDVATIQFDIIPATDSIKFNYVFASEEYNNFVCSNFNDIFGFFIAGPGINGDLNLTPGFPNTKNVALVPNHPNIPVSINTVNNGIGAGTPANCTFTPEGTAAYIDNTLAANHPFIYNNLKFNGLTKVLTAEVKVIPCETYRLTLTIADVTDRAYDSGVFIEKGSLRSSGVTAVQSSVFSARFPYSIVDCNPGKFIFERCANNTVDPLVAKYKVKGTAVNGYDYVQQLPDGSTQLLPDSFLLPSGKAVDSLILIGLDNPSWDTIAEKSVIIRFVSNSRPVNLDGSPNYRGDSTTLKIRRKFVYNAGPDINLCRGTDTTLKPATVPVISDRYRWREVDPIGGDTIQPTSLSCLDCPRPISSTDTTRRYLVYVQDSISQCISTDTVIVNVYNIPTLAVTTNKTGNAVCRGSEVFLSANPPTIDSTWTYQWKKPEPENNGGVEPDSLKKRAFRIISHYKEQFYVVTAKNKLGCPTTDSILVRIATKPIFQLPAGDTVCYKNTYEIKPVYLADTLETEFSWTSTDLSVNLSGETNPFLIINPSRPAKYILTGRNACANAGAVKDTFNIFVIDSISGAHSYTFLIDSLTPSPVQFSSQFTPPTYSRQWTLKNEDTMWDTTLLGDNPLVVFKDAGLITSQAIVYSSQGSHYCADTSRLQLKIAPLGTVFVPNMLSANNDNQNDFFKITAVDKDGKVLREITDGALTVFNRWGKKVYENADYDNTLNGNDVKDKLNDGIYFFEYKNERYKYKSGGWIRVIHD